MRTWEIRVDAAEAGVSLLPVSGEVSHPASQIEVIMQRSCIAAGHGTNAPCQHPEQYIIVLLPHLYLHLAESMPLHDIIVLLPHPHLDLAENVPQPGSQRA